MMARPKGKPRAMADINTAVEMYTAGDRMTDIADRFGVTQPTVSYWMQRYGLAIGGRSFVRSKRKQGRRPDVVPNERDQEIMLWASLGMPASHIAQRVGITRARASYIIKTWSKRGYTPPAVFRPGQIIKDAPDSDSRFVVITANGTSGAVSQTHGLLTCGKKFGKLKTPRHFEKFPWYSGGELCEVVHDAKAS